MTLRRMMSWVMVVTIVGLAWGWFDAATECERRSQLKTLTLGLNTLLRDGSTLQVVDRARFARELSQHGVICHSDRDAGSPSRDRAWIKCWHEKECGIRMPYIGYTDFHFTGDQLVRVSTGVTKRLMDIPGAK